MVTKDTGTLKPRDFSEYHRGCTEVFNDRIIETKVDPNRFIPTQPGTKAPGEAWKGDDKGYHPDDVGQDSLIETGNGIVVIDVDDGDEAPLWARDIIESNPTLSIQSPHAEGIEGHYPFLIDEDVKTRKRPWGEIRCAGALVVTPGTQLTDCKHGCCTPDDPGQYTVKRDLPIAPIEADDLPDFRDEDDNGSEGTAGTFDSDLRQRIEHGRETNEEFDALCRWASKGGDGKPRSERECALACHLAFWLECDKGVVRQAMNWLRPPKWAGRDETYRESVLKAVDVQQDIYTGSSGQSAPSRELTFEVHIEMALESPQKTAEVANHVDYSDRQTRKALEFLEEKGLVEYRRDRREKRWHLVDDDWDILQTLVEELNSIDARDEYLAGMRNHEG